MVGLGGEKHVKNRLKGKKGQLNQMFDIWLYEWVFLEGKREQRKWQECQEAGEAAWGNTVSWDNGVSLPDSGWQNLVFGVWWYLDYLPLNRHQDQNIHSIFGKILLVGCEESPEVAYPGAPCAWKWSFDVRSWGCCRAANFLFGGTICIVQWKKSSSLFTKGN